LGNLVNMTYNDSLFVVSVGGYGPTSYPSLLSSNEWLNLGHVPFGVSSAEKNPVDFDLTSYPNPFSKFTMLTLSLSQASQVKISIVDLAGREVKEICNKNFAAGTQQVSWNAKGFPAGAYFCKVDVNGKVITQKLVKLD